MKIGIVGVGRVGATAAYALVSRAIGREIVLVDKNIVRAQAEADDLGDAISLAEPMTIRVGSYADLVGCWLVILAAGVNPQPGETQPQHMQRNAAVFRDIVPQILDHSPEAVLVVATHPLDVMTHLTAQMAAERGIPRSRVLGIGTTLDTARFRSLLARHLGVEPPHIHGYVIGEQGDTGVLVWSQIGVGGIPLDEFSRRAGVTLNEAARQAIDRGVRQITSRIVEGKGAMYYGIGSVLASMVELILHDQRAIMTVCTPADDVAGIQDVTVSLPYMVGAGGAHERLELPLNDDEQARLHHSASVVKQALDGLK